MRVSRQATGTILWLSAEDTYRWAHRSGMSWPGSSLSGHRVRVVLDARGDLVDLALDGSTDSAYTARVSADELDAIIADSIGSAHLSAADPLRPGQYRRRGQPGGGIRLFEARRKSLKAESQRRRRDALRQARSPRTGRFT